MSFPAHSSYRESGVEWLGPVPDHWQVLPLKRLITIQNGADYKHVEQAEGYPVIGSGGPFTFASDYLYDGESVLLGRKGTVDRPLYVSGRFWTVDTMYWSKIRPGICGRFAYYAATTIPFAYYSTSTALPSMTQGALNGHVVALPSLSEQVSIANFLDRETAKIDALVAEQRRLIELLKEKRQAVISHAVTKGLNPDAPMKDSGVEWLCDVPAHWEVRRLASLFREVVEAGWDALPVLSVSIHDGVSDSEIPEHEMDRKITRSEDRAKYKVVHPNDLVYNMMRAWQGGFGTVTVDGCVSPAYVVARPTAELYTQYIEWLLRTPMLIEEMRRRSVGVADFRLRLYWEEFKEISVPLPPVDEQEQLVCAVRKQIEKFDALSGQATSAVNLLQERRAALISAAVTGKIDVRRAVRQEAEAA